MARPFTEALSALGLHQSRCAFENTTVYVGRDDLERFKTELRKVMDGYLRVSAAAAR